MIVSIWITRRKIHFGPIAIPEMGNTEWKLNTPWMLFLGFCWYMRILRATRHMGRGNTEKFQFTCSYYILYPHDLDIQTKDEFWLIFISFQSCFSPFPDTIQLWLGFTRNLETLDLNSDKSDRSIFLKVSETVFIFSLSLPLLWW